MPNASEVATTRGSDRSAPAATLPIVALGLLLLFSAGLLAKSAARLPFWYDESLTVRFSRLASLGELWAALRAGVEFTPPVIYVATKIARTLPGPETLTARLPGLTGYVLLTVALFVFLNRRIGAWFALASVALLPLADYTVRYAIEARAYMLLLGVSAVALLLWQTLTERRSILASIGLTASVATALLLHVWAVLLPLALLVGELVDLARTRAVRWRTVIALAAASPALAIYPILLRASKTVVFGGPAYEPTLDKLYTAFRSGVPRPRVVVGVFVAALAARWWSGRRVSGSAPTAAQPFRPSEVAVLVALLLSPLVPYVYAETNAGAFMVRYAMFALPAIVCLAGAVAWSLGAGTPLAGQAAALVALLGVALYLPPKIPSAGSQSALVESLLPVERSLDDAIPLVIVNPVDVLAFDDQAPEPLRSRAAFVADSALALAYTGTNGIDLGYERGEPYLNLRVRRLSYGDLTQQHRRVYLVGKWQALSWLPQRLRDDGWTFKQIGGTAQAPIYEAATR
jgi:hypothetical protein